MATLFNIGLFAYFFTLVFGRNFYCNQENAIASFKGPTYDFSVKLLDRVAKDTNYHFVFSPLSTWLQLMTLAEGATGATQNEIRKVSGHHRMKCFRRKFREILNSMDEEFNFMTNWINVIVIDKFLDVKKSFVDEVKKTKRTKIFSLNFNDPEHAAAKVNEATDFDMNGNKELPRIAFDANDFNFRALLMTDGAYFKSNWLTPFNPLYTSTETFYSEEKVAVGKVRLMHQDGSFNLTEVPLINARILELPFNTNHRISMLIFLPTKGTSYDLFYELKKIRLATIFNRFKKEGTKLVKVKLPRFKITSELWNLPELIYDMGIQRIFYPELADFGGITDYPVYASLMTQIVDVEITESGARASVAPYSLIRNPMESFSADSPFAYLIVDRLTETILFGGIYRHPSIY